MGVKYSASESSQLMEAMSNNIQVANEVTDRLSQGCDHLIATLDSGELMGAAYTAGKGLFSEIIIPAVKKLKEAVDDIETELASYREADAQISGYGDLDLDIMKETRTTRIQQLIQIQRQLDDPFTPSLHAGSVNDFLHERETLKNLLQTTENCILELNEKIEKLELFVDQTSQYFSDSLEVLRLAIQGASQLSQVVLDSNGDYYADGVDMSWTAKIQVQKIESYKFDSEAVIKADLKRAIVKRNIRVRHIKESGKSVTEKSEEIVKTYEDFLYNYGGNKKAFEEYARARAKIKEQMEKDGKDFKWEPRVDGSPIQEEAYKIEERLSNELSKSGIDMSQVLQDMGDDVLEVTRSGSTGTLENILSYGNDFGALIGPGIQLSSMLGTVSYQKQFYDLVQTGQPLDLKSRPYNDSNSYSLWARNWGGKYHDDYAGNYLYGYVGQGYLPVGIGSFRTTYLKKAAGVAQGFSDGDFGKYLGNMLNGNWGDNPGDAQTIQDGADAYENREK